MIVIMCNMNREDMIYFSRKEMETSFFHLKKKKITKLQEQEDTFTHCRSTIPQYIVPVVIFNILNLD